MILLLYNVHIVHALKNLRVYKKWNFFLDVGTHTGPYIDENVSKNVTVQKGKTAVLTCRVLNLTERERVSINFKLIIYLHI